MGELVTEPYDTVDGEEYVGYLDRVLHECHRLRAEGRLPDNETVASFLDDAQGILVRIRHDVAAGVADGRRTVVSRLPMTAAEHARLLAMNDSIRNLLEILEFRQAVQLNRTDAVSRVAAAIMAGSHSG